MTMPRPLAAIAIAALVALVYLLWPLSPGSKIDSDKAGNVATLPPQTPADQRQQRVEPAPGFTQ